MVGEQFGDQGLQHFRGRRIGTVGRLDQSAAPAVKFGEEGRYEWITVRGGKAQCVELAGDRSEICLRDRVVCMAGSSAYC